MADERQFGHEPGPGSGLRCEEWETLLTDALDGLLPAGQAAAFNAHSETCANCGDLLAHAKQGQEWLGYLHTEPEIPAGLIGKILEKTVGAGGIPLPVIAGAGAGTGAVAMATPWRRSFHETRLLMTVAMAFFSLALTLNLVTGGHLTSIRLADLRPSQIGSTLSREFFTARGSVVRYYDNLRFVYQLQSRMRELRRDVEQQPAQQQQNQKQEQSKPGGKGGSARRQGTGDRVQGAELRVGLELRQGTGRRAPGTEQSSELRAQGTGLRAHGSEQGAGYRVQSAELKAKLGAGSREPGAEQRSAFGIRRSEKQKAERVALSEQRTEQSAGLRTQNTERPKAAVVVLVSMGTGKWISLGHSGTGLQRAVETAGYEGRSLV